MSGGVENTPKLRFPEFSGEWEKSSFATNGIQIIDGDRGANYPKSADFSSQGECLFLSAKNVTKSGFEFDEMSFISASKDAAMNKGKLDRGDIVLTTRGSLGHIALFSDAVEHDNIRINSGMVLLRTSSKLVPSFVYQQLISRRFQREIERISFGSAQPQLTVQGIKKMPVSVCPLPEQQKIAAFLGAVDAKIGQLTRKKALLEDYKKGCMQQLFTQKLRFKDDQGNDFPDWDTTKLEDIVTIKKGTQLNRDDMIQEGAFPVINGGVTASGYTNSFNAPGGSITISEGGNSCGHVAWQSRDFWLGGHCYVVSANDQKSVLTKFLFHSLRHNQAKIMRLRVGSGLPNIQKGDLLQLTLGIPQPDEQQKIADFLSAIDAKISLVADELSAAQTFKKGLLQQMFV